LELKPDDEEYLTILPSDFYKHQQLLATVTLQRSDCTDSSTLIIPPKTISIDDDDEEPLPTLSLNLRGTFIKQPLRLKDPVDDTFKTFFIFDDLSIRTQDTYKLHCRLTDMSK
jgi:Velvet factor